jgi:hypothetical protein
MSTKKRTAVILGCVAAILGIAGGGLYYGIGKPAAEMARELNARRTRLLCETDFAALLGACRELSRKVAGGELKSGVYTMPELAQFPEPIPALRPSFVTVDANIARVEMGFGGLASYYFGVNAYPEGHTTRLPGDRRLIDGLWYYDEGYRYNPNSYSRKIDQLLINSGRR